MFFISQGGTTKSKIQCINLLNIETTSDYPIGYEMMFDDSEGLYVAEASDQDKKIIDDFQHSIYIKTDKQVVYSGNVRQEIPGRWELNKQAFFSHPLYQSREVYTFKLLEQEIQHNLDKNDKEGAIQKLELIAILFEENAEWAKMMINKLEKSESHSSQKQQNNQSSQPSPKKKKWWQFWK